MLIWANIVRQSSLLRRHMTISRVSVCGTYRDGVVIPDGQLPLSDGERVEILVPAPGVMTPELQAEFDAWERASDEDLTEFERSLREAPDAAR